MSFCGDCVCWCVHYGFDLCSILRESPLQASPQGGSDVVYLTVHQNIEYIQFDTRKYKTESTVLQKDYLVVFLYFFTSPDLSDSVTQSSSAIDQLASYIRHPSVAQ